MTTGSEPAAGFDRWSPGAAASTCTSRSSVDAHRHGHRPFKNDLATSYEASEDGMTWTFNIRDDVKFTDGTPLGAAT